MITTKFDDELSDAIGKLCLGVAFLADYTRSHPVKYFGYAELYADQLGVYRHRLSTHIAGLGTLALWKELDRIANDTRVVEPSLREAAELLAGVVEIRMSILGERTAHEMSDAEEHYVTASISVALYLLQTYRPSELAKRG